MNSSSNLWLRQLILIKLKILSQNNLNTSDITQTEQTLVKYQLQAEQVHKIYLLTAGQNLS